MFGKIMSISDELMWRWFELLSFTSEKEIGVLKKKMEEGTNPRDIKFLLAEELVDRFHSEGDGSKCKEAFLQRFQKGQMPDDIPSMSVDVGAEGIPLVNLLKNCEMTSSTSEAMRLVKQGGVKIDSVKIEDPKMLISKGQESIYQVGKRKFLKIKT
jgi:tyrosyl-tRNA synthetase